MNYFHVNKLKRLALYFALRSLRVYNVEICLGAKIHKSVKFNHPTGVVIGGGADIKKNVIIHQGVTLGAKDFDAITRRGVDCVQVIEEGVILGAGCKILGNVRVGRNSIVAANAVITRNVPENSVIYSNNKIK